MTFERDGVRYVDAEGFFGLAFAIHHADTSEDRIPKRTHVDGQRGQGQGSAITAASCQPGV